MPFRPEMTNTLDEVNRNGDASRELERVRRLTLEYWSGAGTVVHVPSPARIDPLLSDHIRSSQAPFGRARFLSRSGEQKIAGGPVLMGRADPLAVTPPQGTSSARHHRLILLSVPVRPKRFNSNARFGTGCSLEVSAFHSEKDPGGV